MRVFLSRFLYLCRLIFLRRFLTTEAIGVSFRKGPHGVREAGPESIARRIRARMYGLHAAGVAAADPGPTAPYDDADE